MLQVRKQGQSIPCGLVLTGLIEEVGSKVDRILPEAQFLLPPLLIKLQELAFQAGEPFGAVGIIVDLSAELFALNIQMALLDFSKMPLMQPTSLRQQVGGVF